MRCFWAGYLAYDAATFLLACVAAGAIAGGASGALAPAALPAFILTEVCAMPGILALCYLITLPFKNSDEVRATPPASSRATRAPLRSTAPPPPPPPPPPPD